MKEVTLTVVLQVSPDDGELDEQEAHRLARQAVENAVFYAYDNGMQHDREDDVSISLVEVR